MHSFKVCVFGKALNDFTSSRGHSKPLRQKRKIKLWYVDSKWHVDSSCEGAPLLVFVRTIDFLEGLTTAPLYSCSNSGSLSNALH